MASTGSGQWMPSQPSQTTLRHEDYNVGWICALWMEMAAAQAMLDQVHPALPTVEDTNNYILGSIVNHNIVVACLPSGHYGTNNAAIVASNMRRTFPNIKNVFMVGIGGGVPDFADIRLGDVVVSHEVMQYDLGKTATDGHFHHTAIPVRPPQNLLTAVAKLRAHHDVESSQLPDILSRMLRQHPNMSRYARPDLEDRLFSASYDHAETADSCDTCDQSQIVERKARKHSDPVIHYGRVASGNQVLKSGKVRAQLANKFGVLCFEMEAAGLMDQFPGLVIRGICDYADSHKNKHWQEHSAAAAAAYTKELLLLTSVIEPEISNLYENRKVLLDSLYFAQAGSRRANIKAAHKETCEWVLTHPKYVHWQEEENFDDHHGLLWIGGKPGAGKSTLMKYIYTRACGEVKTTANSAVISFFFNARGTELEKSIVGMYRSLLLQVLQSFPDLQGVLDAASVSKMKGTKSVWEIEELQSLLTSTLSKLGQRSLVCFVDALDECDETEIHDIVDFFESLGELAAINHLRLSICSSSRHYPYLQVSIGVRLILEEQHGHKEDMLRYVQSKLKAGKSKTAEEVTNHILAKASGVFMWVVLAVDILNKEFQRGRLFAVKQRLQELPPKLSDLFSDIISRDCENMEDFLLCIQWILYALRPLRYKEFYLALVSGLDPTPENLEPWDSEKITREDVERFVLSASKGLAEITAADEGIDVVQFIHESVRDFFIKDAGFNKLWPDNQVDFEAASHDQLRQCCQNYLGIDISPLIPYEAPLPERWEGQNFELLDQVNEKFPFLRYAVDCVFNHANIAARSISQEKFLRSLDLQAWIRRNNLCQLESSSDQYYSPKTTLVLILSKLGWSRLIKQAIIMESENLIQPEQYVDAAFSATKYGDITTLDTLLEIGKVDPYSQDEIGRTLLTYAAIQDDKYIAQLLIHNYNVDINTVDHDVRTPLIHAAINGTDDVAKLLIDKEQTDINCRDKSGRTALIWATIEGHRGVAEMLLKSNKIEVTIKDASGKTALMHAVENHHDELEKLISGAF